MDGLFCKLCPFDLFPSLEQPREAVLPMEYTITKPCAGLDPFIHFYWELKVSAKQVQPERVFPDGCAGIVINLGNACLTDNGSMVMDFGKTYVVGAMTTYKDSLIDEGTHLVGVCLKPARFANFYRYAPQEDLVNETVELDASRSFNLSETMECPKSYFDRFYTERMNSRENRLGPVIEDIHSSFGGLSVHELSKKHFTTERQLERDFRRLTGLGPKQYSKIVRFRCALASIKSPARKQSLLDIAVECGYYDHAHLSNEVRRITGLWPSQL